MYCAWKKSCLRRHLFMNNNNNIFDIIQIHKLIYNIQKHSQFKVYCLGFLFFVSQYISNTLLFYLLLFSYFCIVSALLFLKMLFSSVSHRGPGNAIILPEISRCVTKAASAVWPRWPAVVKGMCGGRPRHCNQTLALTGVEPRQGTALLSSMQPCSNMAQSGPLTKRESEEKKNKNKCLQISSCTTCLTVKSTLSVSAGCRKPARITVKTSVKDSNWGGKSNRVLKPWINNVNQVFYCKQTLLQQLPGTQKGSCKI